MGEPLETRGTRGAVLSVDQTQALNGFLTIWSDEGMLADLGPGLKCLEAEELAALLRAFGEDGAADTLLSYHAEADDVAGEDHR